MAVLIRGRRTTLVLVAVLSLVLVVVGVIVVEQLQPSSTGGSSVTHLKATLDRVPLPAGAAQVDEHAIAAHGDVEAYLSREYRLPSADGSTAAIRAAIDAAGYRIVNPHTGKVDPTFWTEATSATTGDIYVVPPDTMSGQVEMTWRETRLDMAVQPN